MDSKNLTGGGTESLVDVSNTLLDSELGSLVQTVSSLFGFLLLVCAGWKMIVKLLEVAPGAVVCA